MKIQLLKDQKIAIVKEIALEIIGCITSNDIRYADYNRLIQVFGQAKYPMLDFSGEGVTSMHIIETALRELRESGKVKHRKVGNKAFYSAV